MLPSRNTWFPVLCNACNGFSWFVTWFYIPAVILRRHFFTPMCSMWSLWKLPYHNLLHITFYGIVNLKLIDHEDLSAISKLGYYLTCIAAPFLILICLSCLSELQPLSFLRHTLYKCKLMALRVFVACHDLEALIYSLDIVVMYDNKTILNGIPLSYKIRY